MIYFSMISNKGDRETNEDCVGMYQAEEKFCFALADGLGGHGYGEVASRTAVDTVMEAFAENGTDSSFLSYAFQMAQNKLRNKQQTDFEYSDMKTTLVGLVFDVDRVQWGHVGDSRLYYFSNGKVKQRTLDHSVPQMLVSSGKIREKDIRSHPDRNRLLRVIGDDLDGEMLEVTLSTAMERKKGQVFLLCTDGFWELIKEKKMEALLRKSRTPEEWLLYMQETVEKHGRNKNMDNYSAIAVWDI